MNPPLHKPAQGAPGLHKPGPDGRRRIFPPGTTEDDVRWMIYRREEESVVQICEVVDYIGRLRTELPAHPAADPAIWVVPLDDAIWMGPMGVQVRASLLYRSREGAIRRRLEDVIKQRENADRELTRWTAELKAETARCPRCQQFFRDQPRQQSADPICGVCLAAEQARFAAAEPPAPTRNPKEASHENCRLYAMMSTNGWPKSCATCGHAKDGCVFGFGEMQEAPTGPGRWFAKRQDGAVSWVEVEAKPTSVGNVLCGKLLDYHRVPSMEVSWLTQHGWCYWFRLPEGANV